MKKRPRVRIVQQRLDNGKATAVFAQRLVFRGHANKGKCQVVQRKVPSRPKESAKSSKGVGSRDQRGKLEMPEPEICWTKVVGRMKERCVFSREKGERKGKIIDGRKIVK